MVSDIPSNSGYRPDIDGLRAIAVVSVIIFHINATVLPGGFVGVDVFFVISGYLISRNLLSDVEANRFSLFRFYGRRIKRIAPALLVVTAATLLVSQLVLLPSDAWAAAKADLVLVLRFGPGAAEIVRFQPVLAVVHEQRGLKLQDAERQAEECNERSLHDGIIPPSRSP